MLDLFGQELMYYISFFFISLAGALILGPVIIPQLRKLKFGQAIREEGPKSHLQKSGTPTIGGLIFMTAYFMPICFFLLTSRQVIYVSVALVGFGAIGFLDDYLKVVRKHNQGLKAKQKIGLQLLLSLILAVFALQFGTNIYIPLLGYSIELSYAFIPFIVFVYVAVDNAVNLTDGLDGLNALVTACVMFAYAYIAYLQNNTEMVMVTLAMAGGLIGYLKFNWHPAKVFMGDTGSLGLGGIVTAIAVILKIPLWIPIIGIIYVVETLSVVIQVAVFKRTKKRVFKMSPLHHHFELSGWSEKRIVFTFSAITIVMSIIGIVVY